MQEKKRAVVARFFLSAGKSSMKKVVFLILSAHYIWIGFGYCP